MDKKYLLEALVNTSMIRAHLRDTIKNLEYFKADDLRLKALQIYDEVGKLHEEMDKLMEKKS